MKFFVTQEDIDEGIRGSSCWCPVSRSIYRKIGCSYQFPPSVGSMPCFIKLRPGYEYEMPECVRNFVEKFDAGLTVQPFSFSLPVGWYIWYKRFVCKVIRPLTEFWWKNR